MQVSDRPVAPGHGGASDHGGTTATERTVVEVVADVLDLQGDGITRHDDIFDDLGADSLVVAELCSRFRSEPGMPSLSIKEVYQHATIGGLAGHIDLERMAQTDGAVVDERPSVLDEVVIPQTANPRFDRPVTSAGYWLCGIVQLVVLLAATASTALIVDVSFDQVASASGAWNTYLRSVWVGAAVLGILLTFPVVVKWLLIGRWTPRRIRLWSLDYVRFWIVRIAVQSSPLVLFAGSPIYTMYLRALGASIGRGTIVLSRRVPVCADLLTIGPRSVIREDSSFACYRAQDRHIEVGRVDIGADTFIGEGSVLDIWTEMGDGSQLGHASALWPGQAIPAGSRVVGAPASNEVAHDFTDLPANTSTSGRRAVYSMFQLALLFLGSAPIITSLAIWFLEWRTTSPPTGTRIVVGSVDVAPFTVLAFAGAIFGALIGLRLIGSLVIARLLSRFVRPETVYPSYGTRFLAHRAIKRLTNVRFFTEMLGDSSYILPYFRAIGYDVTSEDQTGANFGQTVVHDNPYVVSVGKGTMAADNLTMPNTTYASSSFRIERVDIGARSFFGNQIIFPPGAVVGENCLLASKVAVPVEGDERSNVGLLGSPSFEIPRLVFRDRGFEERRSGPDFHNTLAKKNAHNLRSMGWFLLYRFVGLLGVVAIAFGAADVFAASGWIGVGAGFVLIAALVPIYRAAVEWAAIGFRRMRPMHLSIYDRASWKIERFWKLSREPRIFNGTPFKGLVWRMHGVRVGRRLFDDGTLITDKTMTTLGDDCTLNALSVLQAHSQEDGSFKSDQIVIGSGCTLGVGSLVHYGTSLHDAVQLEANSFLMKGTEAASDTRWGENPARQLGALSTAPGVERPLDAATTHIHHNGTTSGPTPTWEGQDPTMTTIDTRTTTTNSNGASPADHTRNGVRQPDDDPADALDGDAYWRAALLAGTYTPIPRWTSADTDAEADINVVVSGELYDALGVAAERSEATIGALLLAAHARVVACLTGEDDVVVGYRSSSSAPALPCRLTVTDDPWERLIGAAVTLERDVERNGDVDLDAMRAELNLPGPAFESLVDPTVEVADLPAGSHLAIGFRRGIGGARLVVRHRTSEFDADTAARIAAYHLRALEHIASDPNASVRADSVVSADEIEYQISGLAGPARDLPDRRFHELFELAADEHPDRVACTHLDEQWTYAELNAHANEIGHGLVAAGVDRETVVAVVTERNLAWMASVIAVFKVGGVYLPIEPHFPAGRIDKTLRRAGCTIALTETGSTETLDEALESIPDVTTLLLDDLIGHGATTNPGVTVDVDQLAYIYFTSGSTGEPKGAMCEHAGMINHLFAKIDDFEIADGDVVAQVAPQCFDISLWQLISALLVGGTTVIVDQDTIMQPDRFVDRIVDSGVGVMQVVPSYLEVLLTYLDHHARTLGNVHCVSVTGEALTLELAHRWFGSQTGIKLANAYGLTETSDDTNHEVMREAPIGTVPLGPAVNNAYVYVLDEGLSPVPLGAPGEIVFSGVCVGRGYINDPDRTAAAYLDDPLRPGERLYRSGDFGRWRPDGKLEYLGRRDAQVKIRGFRIEIGEIENTLSEIDGVRRAAVVITDRDDGNQQLVAFYSGARHAGAELGEQLAHTLPEYMVPSAFHWRDSLPLTDNGKIDRKALRADAAETAVDTGAFIAPSGPTEERLAGHWSEILGLPLEQIGRRDHFFDRGGSSLSAVELVVALDNAVSLKEVTGAPVLADLARVLDGELITDGGLLQQLTDPNEPHDATLVCLPYAGGNAVNFQSMARSLRDSGIAVHAVELPGHQLTEDDDEFASIDDTAQRVVAELLDLGDRPMMLWGHSAGAALAIEVARQLRATTVNLHSVVVAAQLPGDAAIRRGHLDHLCSTSDRKIVASMSANTGYGDLDTLDAAQIGHLGAALRHDVVGAHRYFIERLETDADPIDLPLVVIAATDDTATPDATSRYTEWEHFASQVEFREIAGGGHFFIRTEPDLVAAAVRQRLLGEAAAEAEPTPSRRSATRRASRAALGRPIEIESPSDSIARAIVEGDPDPVAFAARHRDTLRGQLVRHGSLLVRGLTFENADDVLAVAQIVSNGLLDDTEAFAPRERHIGHAFSPSAWPANQQMCLHHELSYRFTFPGLMMFTCMQPADRGGAIPVASSSRVLEALPSDLVERFDNEGWSLNRNYTDEIGLSVEEAFGTADRTAIDTYCAENSIDAVWTEDGGLRTSQRRRAVVEHPVTGDRAWFNQIAFLSEWTLKPDVRELLVDMYGADGLPFTTTFGNGDPIGADVIDTINAAYDACTIREPLEQHDLLLLDNISTAHGRDPFDGDREVVVTLGDPWNADVRVPADRRSRRKARAARR